MNSLAWEALGFARDAQAEISDALKAYEQSIAIDADQCRLLVKRCIPFADSRDDCTKPYCVNNKRSTLGGPSLFTYLQVASVLHLAGLDESASAWLDRARDVDPGQFAFERYASSTFCWLRASLKKHLTMSQRRRAKPTDASALDILLWRSFAGPRKTGRSARLHSLAPESKMTMDFTGAFELADARYCSEDVDGARGKRPHHSLQTFEESTSAGGSMATNVGCSRLSPCKHR